MRTVAVLYCDPRGVYSTMSGLDLWDESRDARLYAGPHPVVAHPPCARWSALCHLATQDTADCGPIAVEQVRMWGGVLEHPAGSKLWDWHGLPTPGDATDAYGGRTYEVDQVDWGHVARKRTWLYVVKVDQRWVMRKLAARRGSGVITHWCSGGGTGRGKTPPGIKVCSAQQRRRTPPAFAEMLVGMARASTNAEKPRQP
jgi:hypothetical protein